MDDVDVLAGFVVRITRHPAGRRLMLAGRHVHHGALGVGAILGGLALCAHDRADWRIWLSDLLVAS